MTLAETKTPYELMTVELAKGDHKKEPHLSRQPFGQIPTIDDDGFALYESRAICRYISEKVGGQLIPGDIKARAVMEQWISVETTNFSPYAMKFIYHDVFKRPQEPAVLDAAGKSVQKALSVMEAALAKTPFVAGASFTLADLFFMPYLEYAMGTPIKGMVANAPRVSTWWNAVRERPTWQKVVALAKAA